MMPKREVIRKIKTLNQIAPRAEWAAATRSLVFAEIRRQGHACVPCDDRTRRQPAAGWVRAWQTVRYLAAQPAVHLVFALALAVSSSLTVNAAFYSLPGEPLYRLKIVFERTQLALVSDSAKKVELKVEFAKNRVKELERIFTRRAPETPTEASAVVSQFTNEVASVRRELQRISADQRTAFQIAVSVDRAGSELAAKVRAAPFVQSTQSQQKLQAAVKQALASAEATSLSALEAAVRVPQNATTSLPLTSREVEPYLTEKIAQMVALAASLEVPQTNASSTDPALQAVQGDLQAAQDEVAGGNFPVAVAKITAAKEALDALAKNGVPQPGTPSGAAGAADGRVTADGMAEATSTGGITSGSEAGGLESTKETTEDLLPAP